MDLRVIENLETELSIEIQGEDHTFMNVLKGSLLEVEGVTTATYDMNPEQSGGQTDPIVTVKTDGSIDPLDALAEGAAGVKSNVDAFTESFESAA
jgi:DNA-directed RNA polymerase subunit L